MQAQGHQTSHRMIAELLHELGYSLQANKKTQEGTSHADRNEQFQHIHEEVGRMLTAHQPVISVDTKKKERVGNFKNRGEELRPNGDPEPVRVHDFVIKELGRAAPYGVYDVGINTPRRSRQLSHLCSSEVDHPGRGPLVRKPLTDAALSTSPEASAWVSFREQTRANSGLFRKFRASLIATKVPNH